MPRRCHRPSSSHAPPIGWESVNARPGTQLTRVGSGPSATGSTPSSRVSEVIRRSTAAPDQAIGMLTAHSRLAMTLVRLGGLSWPRSRELERMVQPETRYAKSGPVSIAYQVVGDGAIDLVLVPGFVSHVEVAWEEPKLARFLTRLASFSRLIVFDKRGTGMSDPVASPPSMDERMDDIGAVMDAVGSARAAMFGISEGGTLSLLFADSHPERTQALDPVRLVGPTSRRTGLSVWPVGGEARGSGQRNGTGVGVGRVVGRWAAERVRRRSAPGLVGALPAHGREPGHGPERDPHEHAARHPRRPAEDRRADADPASRRVTRGSTSAMPDISRSTSRTRPTSNCPGSDHRPWLGDVDAIADEIEVFLTGPQEPTSAADEHRRRRAESARTRGGAARRRGVRRHRRSPSACS